MAATVLNAMLPVVITLMLGVIAAWHQDFDEDAASVLNRMVMMYALPLALFAGIVATPRSQLEGDYRLIGIVVVGLLGGYFIPLVLSHWVFRRDIMTSTLQAIAIGGPSVAFVGYPVLGYLFGANAATIPIVVSALVLVLIQVPLSMVLLAAAAAKRGDKNGAPSTIGGCILSAIKQPMVWAPVIGFIIMLAGLPIPDALRKSMALLGQATAGVALFASGVILYSRRITLSMPVALTTLSRNVLVPLAVWGMAILLGLDPKTMHVAVLTLAIPSAVICVILAVQFNAAEQEMASTLFFSTMLSLPTMGVFIWLLGA